MRVAKDERADNHRTLLPYLLHSLHLAFIDGWLCACESKAWGKERESQEGVGGKGEE